VSSPLDLINLVIDKIKAQLKEFEELRQKMIDNPEIDTSASEAAAKSIDESMPD
jgi:hypothetical protein